MSGAGAGKAGAFHIHAIAVPSPLALSDGVDVQSTRFSSACTRHCPAFFLRIGTTLSSCIQLHLSGGQVWWIDNNPINLETGVLWDEVKNTYRPRISESNCRRAPGRLGLMRSASCRC